MVADGMAGVNDYGQVARSLNHQYGTDVQGKAGTVFKGSDSPLTFERAG